MRKTQTYLVSAGKLAPITWKTFVRYSSTAFGLVTGFLSMSGSERISHNVMNIGLQTRCNPSEL
jgi:hypothetical protein